ncbi:MAG: alpha/beta hydrolase [Deltaproteobacteria bacterium]|nr:alpha/beta hydrolase [Deltaproteobacteria bacterium]
MAKQIYVPSFDGTELFVENEGSGFPIVLSDGIGCDGFIWRHIVAALAPRYRMIHWHYRGHGKSKPPVDRSRVDMEALTSDLHAVLDALGIERAVLLGHSMGVQVVLDYALRYPQRVAGVVPICGSYGRPLDTFHDAGWLGAVFPYVREVVSRWPGPAQWLWTHTVGSELAYRYATLVEVDGGLVRREEFKPYFEHMQQMDVMLFIRMLDAVQNHSVEDRLQEITAPALIIAGDRDKFTPVWLSRRMQRLMPKAELLVVPRGTHVAPIEVPELIELRLERFLAPLAS